MNTVKVYIVFKQSGNDIVFSPSTLIFFSCEYHSTNAPNSCFLYVGQTIEVWEPSESNVISEIGKN